MDPDPVAVGKGDGGREVVAGTRVHVARLQADDDRSRRTVLQCAGECRDVDPPLLVGGDGFQGARAEPSKRSDQSIVACCSPVATTRIPRRTPTPSRSTSQPASASTRLLVGGQRDRAQPLRWAHSARLGAPSAAADPRAGAASPAVDRA